MGVGRSAEMRGSFSRLSASNITPWDPDEDEEVGSVFHWF